MMADCLSSSHKLEYLSYFMGTYQQLLNYDEKYQTSRERNCSSLFQLSALLTVRGRLWAVIPSLFKLFSIEHNRRYQFLKTWSCITKCITKTRITLSRIYLYEIRVTLEKYFLVYVMLGVDENFRKFSFHRSLKPVKREVNRKLIPVEILVTTIDDYLRYLIYCYWQIAHRPKGKSVVHEYSVDVFWQQLQAIDDG
uniref:Uncharacterized protein n=1 Tax=Glossina pallidipes TaxID=7398 RepID=A0A1B0A2A5_GLOPL